MQGDDRYKIRPQVDVLFTHGYYGEISWGIITVDETGWLLADRLRLRVSQPEKFRYTEEDD
jgi:hypothetical protein